MIQLSKESLELLRTCLLNHRQDLLYLIDSDKLYDIDQILGDTLRNVVGDELAQSGVGKNGEINKYGIQLDQLIDEIGRHYLYNNRRQ